MTRRRRRALIVLGVLAVLVAVSVPPALRHLRAAGLLLRFEEAQGQAPGWLVHFGEHEVRERGQPLETAGGEMRARYYLPRGEPDAPAVLLVHGVHPKGIDEPRLRHFARVMASCGVRVITPEIEPLTRYRIEASAIDAIGAAAESAARDTGDERVGIVGISFSGGLALLSAAEPEHEPAIEFVLGVGGHHDLARVVRWYAGEEVNGPDGESPPVDPHPYGAGVYIYTQLETFFPEEDLSIARRAMELALGGDWKGARELLPALTDEGGAQLRRVLDREDLGPLREQVLESVERNREQLALASPQGRLDGLDVPVFLVHGSGDPVVPSTETRWLAREVPEDALEQAVVTPFLRHAEKETEPSWEQRWELVHLMAEVLGAAD